MEYFSENVVNGRLLSVFEEEPYHQREDNGQENLQYVVGLLTEVGFGSEPADDLHGRECHEDKHDNGEDEGDYNICHDYTP